MDGETKNSTVLNFRRYPDISFGFVDPAHVLRGCHIIPRFFLWKVFMLMVTVVLKIREIGTQYYVNR